MLIPVSAIPDSDGPTTYPFTFVDDLNRQVTLRQAPRRIISIGPANTEILFAIGAGGLIVGVDEFSNYPPEAKQLTRIGNLISPFFDKIITLQPDVIMVGSSTDGELTDRLVSLGLNVARIAPSNLEEIDKAIGLMGQMTDRRAQAKQVATRMRARIETVQRTVAKIPKAQRLQVFYELWPDPLRTAGPGSFVHELIELAGGVNVANDAKGLWPLFNLETLLARDPQVILTTRQETLQELKAGRRQSWSGLRAVKTGRIVLLDADLISRPGPRLVQALETIARSLYPTLFEADAAAGNRFDAEAESP